MFLSLIFFHLTASVDTFDPKTAQLTCMTKFLMQHSNTSGHQFMINHYLRAEDAEPTDVCALRCVQCTEGVVAAIVWSSFGNRKIELNFRWTPPTIEVIHLHTVLVREFSMRHLPRALKCIHLSYAHRPGNLPFLDMDFPNLPSKLEELYFFECHIKGMLDMRSLPPTMQTICIMNILYADRIKAMLVDNSTLPLDLKSIYVTVTESGFRVIPPKHLDKRIQTKEQKGFNFQSQRFDVCRQYLLDIQKQKAKESRQRAERLGRPQL